MDSQSKIFNQIVTFVDDLATEFGTKQHSLILYNRLLSKTKLEHQDSVKKHIKAFENFTNKNRLAILDKDVTKFVDTKILYSVKVHIKMDEIFKMADTNTSNNIWKYLLVITRMINPADTAVLKLLEKVNEEKSNESNFLTNIISDIEKHVDPNTTDPMAAIMGLVSSGAFTNIISTMSASVEDGSIDMNKLFGSVQGMMSTFIQQPTKQSSPITEVSNTTSLDELKEE
jgi:hypothetical protein